MRRILLVLLLALSGCSKSSTAPKDPNAALYGIWQGNVQSTDGVTNYNDTMQLTLRPGSAALILSGTQYPAALQGIADPNVVFVANVYGYVGTFTGQRSAGSMNGVVSFAGTTLVGNFACTKVSAVAQP